MKLNQLIDKKLYHMDFKPLNILLKIIENNDFKIGIKYDDFKY